MINQIINNNFTFKKTWIINYDWIDNAAYFHDWLNQQTANSDINSPT